MPENKREKTATGERAAFALTWFTCNAMRTSSGGRLVDTLPAPWATPIAWSNLKDRTIGQPKFTLTRCTH